ncbi:MAG: hypothetical protein ACO1N2_03815 [Candidatus Saccharimonadota bacterium]
MKKIFLISSFLVFSLLGGLFASSDALAKGESYEFSGSSATNGYGGTKIVASGGAFASKTTFTKVNESEAKKFDALVSGYNTYYKATKINLLEGASIYPACRTDTGFIALKSAESSKGLLYHAPSEGCSDMVGFNFENMGATEDAFVLSNDLTIKADSVWLAMIDGYGAALSSPLNEIKNAYYRSLQNPPCSSQGCNDTTWNRTVGACWATARTSAADTARWTRSADFDTAKATKEAFASCLSGKTNGVATSAQILQRIDDEVDVATINRGGSAAAQQAEDALAASQNPGGGGETDEQSSCAIDGIGWIVCPVVNFLAGLADGSFTILSDTLLRTDVNIISTDSPTYEAWVIMRNIANVLFVIVFLIIIFSQLTGSGISNYGVKKMLPRLVVAAILVNMSFIICQLAVDLSNILGYSIKDAIGGVGVDIIEASGSTDGVSPWAGGDGFLGIAGGVLAIAAGGVLIYAMISVLVPVLLAAVLALVMILFILIARQALIVILIVLSPLAFVAFLLPNTEKLFTQWRKIFTSLLLVFPITALVFGLSSLTADILSVTFSGDAGETSANNWFGQIIAAAVLVLPLFAIPMILKKSLDAVPMLGQMANKWANKANGNLGSKLKQSYQGSLMGRGAAIRRQGRENYRTKKYAERISKGGFWGTTNQVLSSGIPILPADRAANKALKRSAADTAADALVKDAAAAGRTMEGKVDKAGARTIALGGSASGFNGGKDLSTRIAAMDKVVQSNDIVGMNQLWDQSKTWTGPDGDKMRTALARSIQASGNKPAYFGAGALEGLRLNSPEHLATDSNQLMTGAVAAGAYSPEKIAGADKDELSAVYHASNTRAAADATYAVSGHSRLVDSATNALDDPELFRVMSKNRDNVTGIAGRGPAPPVIS